MRERHLVSLGATPGRLGHGTEDDDEDMHSAVSEPEVRDFDVTDGRARHVFLKQWQRQEQQHGEREKPCPLSPPPTTLYIRWTLAW